MKYYKGLGTSTNIEAKEYFRDLDKHVIRFKQLQADRGDNQAIELAFSKSQADARKDWLSNYDQSICIDHSVKSIGLHQFIH